MQRLRMASAGMLLVSLMCRMAYSVCPTRRYVVENGSGTWRTKGEVEESDIIVTLPEPCAVGIIFHAKAEEKYVVDRLFRSIIVYL